MRNKLVQYQGGGYDGCIWEWNFCYFDADGVFHDIQSTGCCGCGTAAAMVDMLAEHHSSVHIYDLTKAEDLAKFSRESNPAQVAGVLQWCNDNGIEFYVVCSVCQDEIEYFDDVQVEDSVICSDCHSTGMCYCCGEYVGAAALDYEQDVDDCSSETKQSLALFDDNNGPVCAYCWEAKRDELIADENEDTLAMSLATGSPDLFSPEMRWFWNK